MKKEEGVWRICIQRQPEGKKWTLLKYASKKSEKLCSPFYGRLEKFLYMVVITDKIRKVKSLYRLFLLSLQSVYQTLSKTGISDKKWAKTHTQKRKKQWDPNVDMMLIWLTWDSITLSLFSCSFNPLRYLDKLSTLWKQKWCAAERKRNASN